MLKGIVFFIVTFLFVLAGLYVADILLPLTHLASAVIVVLGVIFLLYMAFPVSDLLEALGFIFGRKKGMPLEKKSKLSILYQAGGDLALLTGLWCTLIGVVLMLTEMHDSSTIGPRLAVALVTLLYGLAAKLMAVLAQRKLNLCEVREESYEIGPASPARQFVTGLILFIILAVLVLLRSGGSLATFFDTASLLIVVGGSVFGLLFFTCELGIADSLKAVFSPAALSAEQGKRAVRISWQFNDIIAATMLMAALSGLIVMLRSSAEVVGPIMALVLISIFYAIFLIFLARAASCILHRKLLGMNEQIDESPVFTANVVTFLALAALLVAVVILIALMGS
jgi:flagellar motor component MotA